MLTATIQRLHVLSGTPTPSEASESLMRFLARAARLQPQATYGLGAAFADFEAFFIGGTSSTYKDPDGITACTKDASNSPICWLLAYPRGTSKAALGPVAELQKATDALLLKIPVYNLEGAQLKLTVPDGKGGTYETTKTLDPLPKDAVGHGPVYIEAGRYDGVMGPRTLKWILVSAVLAGALKDPPGDAVAALATPYRVDWITAQAAGITAYFRDVVANFDSLLQAYRDRGMKPAATPLAPETITQIIVLPAPIKKFPTAKVVSLSLVAAAVVGVSVYALTSQPGAPGSAPAKPPLMPTEAMMGRRRRRHNPNRHPWISQWRANS